MSLPRRVWLAWLRVEYVALAFILPVAGLEGLLAAFLAPAHPPLAIAGSLGASALAPWCWEMAKGVR
jgi:hypothetical protein